MTEETPLPGMRRCGRSPTPSQALCPTCCRLFGGVTGFDMHRVNGHCVDPSPLGMVEQGGVWRRPVDHENVALIHGCFAQGSSRKLTQMASAPDSGSPQGDEKARG